MGVKTMRYDREKPGTKKISSHRMRKKDARLRGGGETKNQKKKKLNQRVEGRNNCTFQGGKAHLVAAPKSNARSERKRIPHEGEELKDWRSDLRGNCLVYGGGKEGESSSNNRKGPTTSPCEKPRVGGSRLLV